MTTRHAAWLAGIVLLGLTLRLLPLLHGGDHPNLFMQADSWGYHRIAGNLLAGNGYSWDEQPPYAPNLYRPPVLPALLTTLYAPAGPSIPLAILVQIAVGTLTIVGMYALGRALVGDGPLPLLAAAVQAIDPLAVLYNNLLLTETFTSLLALLVVLGLVRFVRSEGQRSLLPAALVLGVGIVLHPVLVFAPAFLLLAPLLTSATRTRRQIAMATLAAALAWTPAGLWVVRNHVVGDYAGLSSVAAVNMLKYKAAGVMAELNGTTREAERDRLTDECDATLPAGFSRADQFRAWSRRGTEILLAHPVVYAKVHARGAVVELIGPERDLVTAFLYGPRLPRDEQVTDAKVAAVQRAAPNAVYERIRWATLGVQGVLLLGLGVGVAVLIARRQWGLLLTLLALPALILLLTGGPEGSPRFRVIYLPMLSLTAAVGAQAAWGWLAALVSLLQRRPSRQPLPAAA